MLRKLAVIKTDGQLACIEEDMPELKDGEVLIETYATLISPGTEMNLAKTRRAKADEKGKDVPFGYSAAGIIIDTKGDVKNLKPGMRVAAMGGGAQHASYIAVPVNLVVPIPDNVTFEQATYLSLAATSLQAVRRTTPLLGEYGAVLGLGIVGNLAAQLYRICGARVIGWEGFANRMKIAKKCGITEFANFKKDNVVEMTNAFSNPFGLDFALFAFGGNAEQSFLNIKNCMKVSADGHIMGRVVLVGGCFTPVYGGAYTGNLDIRISSRTGAGYHDSAWEYGKDYPPAFVQFTSNRNGQELVRLMAEKRLLVTPMTTHNLDIENISLAGDLLINTPDKALGVIIKYR